MRVDPIGLNGGITLFLYAFNNPINNSDAFGLRPIACYRPMMGHNEKMGELAVLWHAFIKLSNGQKLSAPAEPNKYESGHAHCYPAEREDECDVRPWSEIETCLVNNGPSGAITLFDTCGVKVRKAFITCGLKDPTPWWLIYPEL